MPKCVTREPQIVGSAAEEQVLSEIDSQQRGLDAYQEDVCVSTAWEGNE